RRSAGAARVRRREGARPRRVCGRVVSTAGVAEGTGRTRAPKAAASAWAATVIVAYEPAPARPPVCTRPQTARGGVRPPVRTPPREGTPDGRLCLRRGGLAQ